MGALSNGHSGDSGAFIDPDVRIQGSLTGPLQGLSFALKDLYDVEGLATGHGNPTWRATHAPASQHAPVVKALLQAGASLAGTTHMDELAYSLNGENVHYGTPINPACPDRIPGGSSSGSAVAVADGTVDFAMGSDTGGSVRIPASFCGIPGIRPTHGRVSLEGACPLAPSLDTGGWFAKDIDLLAKVGSVILEPSTRRKVAFKRVLLPTDALAQAAPATADSFRQLIKQHHNLLAKLAATPVGVTLSDLKDLQGLAAWVEPFRLVQAYEAWQALGGWITEAKPKFGRGIKERFEAAAKVTAEQFEEAKAKRERIRAHVEGLLGSNGLLLLPTAPGPAIKLQTPEQEVDTFRNGVLRLTCTAGLCGLPQVSLPVLQVDGCPVGLGLVGPKGSDEDLLTLAQQLYPALLTSDPL